MRVTPIDQVIDILRKKDREFSDFAQEKGVSEAFAAFCSTDVLHISGDGVPTIGKAAVVQMMQQFEHNYTMTWTPEIIQVNSDLITGVTKGSYNLFKLAAESVREKIGTGQYLTVWKKQPSKEWMVIYDMDGGIFQK